MKINYKGLALALLGLPLALGLEQMEASQQPHLDRYNRAEIDFEQLAEATAWAKRWQNYEQYRAVLEASRKAKAPVLALNAQAETIRQVARSGGIDRLPPEVRKQLPAKVQLQDPPYEKPLALQMMVHAAATPETLRPMIEAQRLSQEVRRILGSIKSTQYSHKTEIDEPAGKYFCDCSGLACYVLQQKLPQHYKAIAKPNRRARPLAEDFYKFFAALPEGPAGRDGWRQVAKLMDARPGDILAWQSKNPKTGSTGHVVVIDGVPIREKNGQVRIQIIDSTSRGHGSDTRNSGESGIGRGTMWFTVDDRGRPTGYRWSSAGGKLQERPIAVGRAVDTAAHRDTPPSEKP